MEKKYFSEDDLFEPINEKVYKYLYNAIINLEYRPGAVLVESKIAADLNISRSPVKAALERLERQNLVENPYGKSPRVAGIRYEDCAALLEARRGIEGWAAYYAAYRITDEELDQLHSILLQFQIKEDVPDADEYARIDAYFHGCIIKSSRSKYLIDAYKLIQANLLRYRIYIMRRLDIAGLHEYEHHLPVYCALKNHCSTLAKDEIIASIDHMTSAMRYL
ncbi:MAG: GntR family transcriptional regulator [Anaerovoracaceae bacterium]|jgi:DNA-binding GntR family transcriptional regulator